MYSFLVVFILVGVAVAFLVAHERGGGEIDPSTAAYAGVCLAGLGWVIAVAATIAMLRDHHFDACSHQQPWWNSSLMQLVPLLAIAALVSAVVSPGGTRRRFVLRAVASVAAVGLFAWMVWDFLRLFTLDCGFF